MTPRQMFEKLGFSYDDSIVNEINYFNKKFISDTNVISFNLEDKTVSSFIESDDPFTPNRPYELNLDELKSIILQIDELGWFN